MMVELSHEAEDNATSRLLHRIPPPAEAEGFQTAGLISFPHCEPSSGQT